MAPALTREEAAYLRIELLPRFGTVPNLADGIMLRSWKSGPLSGSPRLPPAVKSLQERGLVQVRQASPNQPFRAFWTVSGLQALAEAVRDRRSFHPDRYAHLIHQLEPYLATNDGSV